MSPPRMPGAWDVPDVFVWRPAFGKFLFGHASPRRCPQCHLGELPCCRGFVTRLGYPGHLHPKCTQGALPARWPAAGGSWHASTTSGADRKSSTSKSPSPRHCKAFISSREPNVSPKSGSVASNIPIGGSRGTVAGWSSEVVAGARSASGDRDTVAGWDSEVVAGARSTIRSVHASPSSTIIFEGGW